VFLLKKRATATTDDAKPFSIFQMEGLVMFTPIMRRVPVRITVRVRNQPSLYAIDIMNEPEAMYDPSCFPVVSADSMKTFLIVCHKMLKSFW
jgi:hypothetical protein